MTGSASAGVLYSASGEDLYRIQSAATSSRVTYSGTERLSISPESKGWRFEARARYTRDGPDGKESATARFVQVLQADGSFEDRIDDDPDFLTILNQPFAVRLDKPTLRDLRTLHGSVPFSATSPLGAQAVLRGYLHPATGGPIDGRPTAAVRFEADGAMTGPLPGYSGMLVSGTMRMDGTAYYALDDATLLALNVALTLDARLSQGHPAVSVPVKIVYRRAIRATASAKTPPPAPLARGAGTVAPATP
ncbi:MAG TPA: hypothetical protein VHT92_01520 [Candidatus Cybelea sp.]|nr:hypothetical protein [Candidatus Cybelea sp.]